MKVLTVLGTRPEAIKLAPVLLALRATPSVQSLLCVSGQHREMLDPMLKSFNLRADQDLRVMQPGQSLAQLTQTILLGVEGILNAEKPDWLVVQGDTTTAMAAALAAFYAKVPIAHVEAGLRTYNAQAPWPEEVNRRLISPMAHLHFAPTTESAKNLLAEGLAADSVLVTGNTVIDALMFMLSKPSAEAELDAKLDQYAPVLRHTSKRIVLVTLHRRENQGARLEVLCNVVRILASRGDLDVVFPVHLSPQVQQVVRGALDHIPGVHLLPPLDYSNFLALLRRSHLVLTDSGGLQEEAAALHIPLVVARDITERPEAIAAGTAVLGGTAFDALLSVCNQLLDDPSRHAQMVAAPCPFGDGHSASRIVQALVRFQRP